MFTGIIEATGTLAASNPRGGDVRMTIASDTLEFGDVGLGDSIAVNGVCLTVIALEDRAFLADVSNETLRCTSLVSVKEGAMVNLEKAMTPTSRLGGHIVSGHVDGLATLQSRTPEGRSEKLVYEVPAELARYVAAKGSVCLDGVSLTVNEVHGQKFSVNIIPHTAQQTTIQHYQPGQQVNLEVDVVARYLERLLTAGGQGAQGLSLDTLRSAGFA